MNSLYTIFGLSGVGKTTACRAYVKDHPLFVHVEASRLLREITGRTDRELRSAKKQEIEVNQTLLANAVKRKQAECADRPMLLEGHSIIEAEQGAVPVPLQVFRTLAPTGMIFLEAPPGMIEERRRESKRNLPRKHAAEIDRLQAQAKELLTETSKALSVPLLIGAVQPGFTIDALISDLIGTRSGQN